MFFMKKLTTMHRDKRFFGVIAALSLTLVCGCGSDSASAMAQTTSEAAQGDDAVEDLSAGTEEKVDALTGESAGDGKVDFETLKALNDDIFGWIYIADGTIDAPILQNADDDQFYMTHNSLGAADDSGAVFTEFPGRLDFCEFNEVIYGVDGGFLRSYMDPDFFDENRVIEIYKDGDKMTYEVLMARKWPKEDLLTHYAFTVDYDCRNFLRDTYDSVSLSDNVDPRYKLLTDMNFLITLVTDLPEDPEKQFMVIAMLADTENGTIDYPQGDIEWIYD